eukprot:4837303-Pleurochrysis_carterae.AAC.2
MPAINMFRSGMVFGIIRKVNCGLVVERERRRFCSRQSELCDERSQVASFFRSFGGRDYFSLT